MTKSFVPHFWLCFCLTWLLVTIRTDLKASTVLYQEHFNYPAGGGSNAITIGASQLPWQAYATSSATNITAGGAGKYNVWVSHLNATPTQTSLGGTFTRVPIPPL